MKVIYLFSRIKQLLENKTVIRRIEKKYSFTQFALDTFLRNKTDEQIKSNVAHVTESLQTSRAELTDIACCAQ